MDDVIESMQKIKIDESLLFICKTCGTSFNAAGYLDRYLQEKHDAPEQLFKCDNCDKILASKRNLATHVLKIHRKRKVCQHVCDYNDDLMKHKRIHTTCKICNIFYTTKSALPLDSIISIFTR